MFSAILCAVRERTLIFDIKKTLDLGVDKIEQMCYNRDS